VTGAPGVGKSSFIARFATALRKRDHRVAVIAVDPSSPITGGSVLGDRLRMMSNEPDEGLFIRSLASRNVAGGIGPHAADCVRLAGVGGYPIVLVETVGAGQGDTEVRKVAGEVLMLVMPGAGDVVQFFKAGIMEIATGFVVNKCDLAGADNTIRELTETIEDKRPIWPVSSLRDEGVEPLCEWVEAKLAG
jgi:LAO/AO transport system kinase